VEGEQFTAEVIAKVKSTDARELVRQFSGDLQKVYQLVEGLEVKRIGQQRLSRYRFANNLFHRYLYDNFDPVELSYVHEVVGLALEALYGEQADDIAPALARHFELAALTDKARAYLTIAGERAMVDFAYGAALDFFSRALQLTPSDDAAARYPLLANRQRMHDLLGQRDAQRADLDELGQLDVQMPVDPQRTAELHIRRAILARRTSDFQVVIAEVQRAIQLIQANPELASVTFTLLVDGYLLWGRAQSILGDNEQALSQLEKALMVSRAYKYPLGECGAQNLLGMIHWAAGNYAEANDHLNEALPLARSSGDLRRESEALQNLGVVASDEQRYDDAINFYQQAQAIAQRSGDRVTETGVLINLGNLHQDMLEYERARIMTMQAVQLARDLDDRMMQAISLINLGEIERELGEYAQAEADAARAFDLAQAIRYRRGQAILLANRGRIALAQGQAEHALRLGQDALALACEIASRYAQDQATLIIGQALLQLSRWTEAEQHYTAALADWQDGEDVTQQVEARVGYAAAAMGRSITELQLDETISLLLNPQQQTHALPLWAYLQCARILLARQDGRAMAMIARAQAELQSRASRIADADTRQSYLHIADHRAILALA
jgi:tetratricopeptide (TPR) repeat protein